MRACAWTDGSNGRSRGPAGAAAYVIALPDTLTVIEERCQLFPHTEDHRFTNNDMEMTAILLCLQAALRIGVEDLILHCDSEWCVKILRKEYQLRDMSKKTLVDSIYKVASEFDFVSIHHIPREKNKRADYLCRKATNQRCAASPPRLFVSRPRPQRSLAE